MFILLSTALGTEANIDTPESTEATDSNWLKTNSQVISILAAATAAFFLFLTFIVSLVTHRQTKETMQLQTFLHLREEYRSKEVGIAISRLWELYRDECKETKCFLITHYVTQSMGIKKRMLWSIHNQRRMVSQLYQELENLLRKNTITEELIFSYWSWGDLRIIPEIIDPIETNAIPILLEGKEHEESADWINNLKILCKEAKKRSNQKNVIETEESKK